MSNCSILLPNSMKCVLGRSDPLKGHFKTINRYKLHIYLQQRMMALSTSTSIF